MTKRLLFAVAFSVVGLTAQASAAVISFHFDGSGNALASSPSIASTSVINEPGSTATAVRYGYTPSTGTSNGFGGFSNFNGTGVVTLMGGSLNFSFVGSNDSSGSLVGAILSFTGGTGFYSGVSGTGLVSHTVTGSNTVGGQFVTDVQAVPEPASFLALGLGAATLVRRRARKAN